MWCLQQQCCCWILEGNQQDCQIVRNIWGIYGNSMPSNSKRGNTFILVTGIFICYLWCLVGALSPHHRVAPFKPSPICLSACLSTHLEVSTGLGLTLERFLVSIILSLPYRSILTKFMSIAPFNTLYHSCETFHPDSSLISWPFEVF